MQPARHGLAMGLVAAALLLAAPACGGDDDAATDGTSSSASPFVPVRPLSRGEYHAFVVAAGPDQRALDAGSARRMYDALCRGDLLTIANSAFAYPNQAAAYERVFDDAQVNCQPDPTALDRARGEAAWSMTGNQLELDQLLHPATEAVDGFCGGLRATEDITSPLIAQAVESANLVPNGAADLVKLGVSLLIQACPDLLALVRG
jgi:hypothetical protein